MTPLAVALVGLDHRYSPAGMLERAQAAARSAALPFGCVAVVTCHRVELYVPTAAPAEAIGRFAAWLGLDEVRILRPMLRVEVGESAAVHVLRVAAGLESAVLGEDQVLGQLRAAYRTACAVGRPDPLLHRLFHAAFRAGRRARAETAIQGGVRSLAGAAVRWLEERLGGVGGRRVLVLGAGEMATLVANRLRERAVGRLLVCNRTAARAADLAAACGAETVSWAWRRTALSTVDAVVCATGAPDPVVASDWLEAESRRGRRLAVVDLAMPRNVEDAAGRFAELADVAVLGEMLQADAVQRKACIRDVECLIAQEVRCWVAWAGARAGGGLGVGGSRARVAG